MNFLDDYDKELQKAGIYTGEARPPRYWFSTGNYALNRIISGSFYKGIPQGRVTGLMGPSGAGKSFLIANIMRQAQQEGAFVLAIDTEHALDNDFVEAIGVDTSNDVYHYVEANTFADLKKAVSSFIKAYKKQFGDGEDAMKLLIAIDSLDMLITDSEEKHFLDGKVVGDQGQRTKQTKSILREFVQSIKHNNISIVATGDVYKNQDPLNGEGTWIVTEGVRFSLSQIILLTKLKLKSKDKTEIVGINMRCDGFKTRFTKPFQRVEIEVPYDTGMNPYSGLLDAAKALEVVNLSGAWYSIPDTNIKFYAKDIATHSEKVLELCEAKSKTFLNVEEGEEENIDTSESVKKRRTKKYYESDK